VFFVTEAKGKIVRESSSIPSHLFKQSLGRDAVEPGEIAVENDLNASNRVD
jgi:hypothetical protein